MHKNKYSHFVDTQTKNNSTIFFCHHNHGSCLCSESCEIGFSMIQKCFPKFSEFLSVGEHTAKIQLRNVLRSS